MTLAEKRKEMIEKLQLKYSNLGKIDSVLDSYSILCDKCTIKETCHFVYSEYAVTLKHYNQKADKSDSDFSKVECMFLVKNPRFEYLQYTGKKKAVA